MKVDYGAVALIPKGEFDATKQYAVNDLVSYNGSSFIVKAVPPIGTLPTNTAYFAVNASGTSPATSSTVGTVKPDNSTIGVDNDGTISVKSEVLDRISSSEQALTVNLLNPILSSGTWSGITVVKNEDNSYTISGTNTSEGTSTLVFALIASIGFESGKTYRVLGCPSNTPAGVYMRVGGQIKENGEGANFSYPVQSGQQIFISIVAGTVIETPITIKPMITTNLSATYDDFVPFSGSSGKLDTDYKTLSEKIGNVGNTDLQSQINTANQSIAQNTTDIAANAAGISALNTGLANISNAVQPIGNTQYGGVDTLNITQQQINTWIDVDSTLTLGAGTYVISLYAHAPNIAPNTDAYISIFNDLSYPLFEKICELKNGTNISRDAYTTMTIFLNLQSQYTFHPVINANAVMSDVKMELSAIRIK